MKFVSYLLYLICFGNTLQHLPLIMGQGNLIFQKNLPDITNHTKCCIFTEIIFVKNLFFTGKLLHILHFV